MMDANVTTRDAARIYGCSTDHLIRAMKLEGVKPTVIHGGGSRRTPRRYEWNVSDVIRVRTIRTNRLDAAQKRFAKKPPKNYPRAVALARVTRQERERMKILQRVAAREGRDVKELMVAKGILHLYREV